MKHTEKIYWYRSLTKHKEMIDHIRLNRRENLAKEKHDRIVISIVVLENYIQTDDDNSVYVK